MSVLPLLLELKRLAINIELVDGQLKIDAPAGKLTPGLIEELKSKKAEIIDFMQENLQKKVKYESVEPSEKKEYYPLSAAQKRLYILQQMDVDITGYNLPQALALQGDVNIPRLVKTFEKLVSRHESLRTSFHMINDEPVQVVHDDVKFEMENCDTGNRQQAIGNKGKISFLKNFVRPFDLSGAPLLRVRLVKEENKKYVLMVDMHHIISDGTSQGILTKEFMFLYKGNELAPLRLQYKDYSRWQNSPKVQDAIRQQEEFWRQQFDGDIPALSLPYDYPRPALQRFEGNTEGFELDTRETRRLKELALKQGTTLFMVLLAVYNIFLSKVSGQEDIVVGTPIAGRQHGDLESIIGMFVNTLALRSYSWGKKRFTEYLEEIKQKTLKAFENQDYPFEELVEMVFTHRDLSRNPLFDVMFVLQNILGPREDEAKPTMQDIKITPRPVEEGASKFDLSLFAAEREERLYLTFEYCTRLFKDETLARFIKYINAIILSVIENPGKKISEIGIIWEEEKNRILFDFNDTAADYPQGKTIHELFEQQVERTPDSIALHGCMDAWVHEEADITYRELNEKAHQLAYVLKEKGIKPGTIVGIMVERSLEMIIGILGILKAGGAYMPVEPDYPEERINYMLKDSGAKILLTSHEIVNSFGIWNLEFGISPRQGGQLAYILYTSGSTGKPKGVMVQHCSVVNVLSALFKMYPFLETDVYLLKTSFLFDVSVSEIFGWYWGGGRLAILGKDDHKDPWKILDAVESLKVTHINFVPSMFNAFLDTLDERNISKLSRLKYIFLAGEALLTVLVEKFRRLDTGIVLENIYGPTEGTVYSSRYSLSRWQGGENIPIGGPIQNIQLYILGKDNQLQPMGIPGELRIAGIGVARGYLNNPELTFERFRNYKLQITNYKQKINEQLLRGVQGGSFLEKSPPGRWRQKLYKTGDLARWLPDGDIEFLGRTDHQVKIRGFRVELGEIENLLLTGDKVKEAVVITREREDKDKYLCAYIVPVGTREESGKGPDINRLKEYLADKLPRYMVPDHFVILDQIPLTSSGKIDRKALPVSELKEEEGLIPPRDKTGKKLVEIWSKVLGIKREIIGINSNFFQLGGHSLRATLLVSKICKEFNIKMTIAEVFARPRLKDLAGYISRAERRIFEAIMPVEKREYYPQSSAQKRLFLLDQFEDIGTSYHTPVVFKIKGEIHKEKYENVINALILRHETLRTSFQLMDNEAVQRIHREVDFEIEEIPHLGKDIKKIIKDFVRPFDLARVPLLRIGLVPLSKEEYLFLFDMHHIIGDGTSMGILINEFGGFYEEGEVLPLRVQYKDFSCWQNLLFKKGKIQLQEKYWSELYSDTDEIPKLNLPTDYPRPAVFSYKGDSYSLKPNLEDSIRFKEISTRFGVTPFMNLLAVFNLVLFKYTGQEDIIVGCDIAGRPHVDLQHILGMFVNELAIRNFPQGRKSYREFLEEVKENSLSAFENQDYQFEELVERLNLDRDTSRNPLFDVEFAFQNFERPAIELKDVSVTPFGYENKTANFDIAFNARESGDQIYLGIQYCTSLFERKTIESLAGHLLNAMRAVSRNPGTLLADISILSEEEKQQILCEFNDTKRDFARDKSYPQLLEIQAARTPDRIAAIYKDEFLSYGQLDETSGQLAQYLYYKKNIREEDRVGVVLDRSNYFLTAVIGIMKAGAAYIPIEPFMPEERVKTIINDAKINVLVSQVKYLETLRRLHEKCKEFHTILCLDNDNEQPLIKSFCRGSPDVSRGQFFQKAPPLAAGGIAYIIYTSGTTGEPKGVMIHQRGMINHLYAKINDLSITGEDIIAQTAPAGFDISVWQFLAALLKGGVTLIIDKEIVLEPGQFLQVLQEGRVTILESVPSLMTAFLEIISIKEDRKLKYLRWMVPTGEALSTALVRRWYDVYPGIKLVNAYGPTEAADDVTHYVVNYVPPETQLTIPIGKPLQNLHVYILDKYFSLCPVGVRGEICVSGLGVGKGYLNNPELTFEKFFLRWPGGAIFEKTAPVKHPDSPCKNFLLKGTSVKEYYRSYRSYMAYIYKTGDIGYWQEDGNIECLGRIDQQVKIRGNRIELGDIETQLLKHGYINEAVVIAKDDEKGNKNLYSYFVSGKTIDASQLREYLQEVLPDYMIPAYFVQLDKIPITPNGKLDRKRLPDPGPVGTGDRYIPPRDKIEEKLVEIWSEVLGIEKNTISIDDDFFRLGGHSLRATILTAKIHKELNVKLPIAEVFRTPIIRGIAKYIKEAAGERFIPIEPVEAKDYYPLSSVQKRLYVLQQMVSDNMSYNLPQVLWLEGDIDIEKLNETFIRLISRHESLRTSFRMVGNEPVQRVQDEVEFEMEYFDLATEDTENTEGTRGLAPLPIEPAARSPQPAAALISSFIRPFDLSRAPLLRAGVIKLPHTPAALHGHPRRGTYNSQEGKEPKQILMIDLHHIITDGLSQVLLTKEFVSLYAGQVLSPLRLQYKDYSGWQNHEKIREEFKHQEIFWLKEFSGEIPVLNMPLDYLRPPVQSFAGSHLGFSLSEEETHSLNELARSRGATLFMILLAVYDILLSKISLQEDIVVGTPVAGRRHDDLEPIIGMFVNTLALRSFPCGEKTFTGFLNQVKEKTLNAFENQDYPFEDLVEKVTVERDMSRNPVFDTLFVLQNMDIAAAETPGLKLKPYPRENKTSKFDLSLNGIEAGKKIHLEFEYCTKLFKHETIERLITYFKKIVSSVINDTNLEISQIEIISEAEKKQMLFDFNDTEAAYPANKTIDQLFREQVKQQPLQAAVSSFLNLTYIYERLEHGKTDHYIREQFETFCFKKNPYVFQFEDSTFLKALNLFRSGEEQELIMLLTQHSRHTAVNRWVLLLLDYFDGKTNIKSILKGLANKNCQFLIYNIKRDTGETDFYLGNRVRIVSNKNTGLSELLLLVKTLVQSNLIELVDYCSKTVNLDVSRDRERGEADEKVPGEEPEVKADGRVKSPVLLLGDSTGNASIGLLYIASFLRRNGIEAYCQWNDINITGDLLKNNVETLLAGIQPKLVGVSMKWFPHIARSLEICRIVREFDPSIIIVVGGNTASYYKEEIIKYDQVDYVITGDGEVPILKLCLGEDHIPNCVYKKDGEVIATPISYVQDEKNSSEIYLSHLQRIFVTERDPYLSPYFYICTGKGCSMQCFYCGGCRDAQEKIFNRPKPFMRGVKEVRNDIIAARGYTAFFLFDFDLPAYESIDYYKNIWEGIDLSNHFCRFYFWILPSSEFLDYVVKVFKYVYINIDLCSLSESHRLKLSSLGLVKPQPTDEELFSFFHRCAKYNNLEVIINQVTGLPYFAPEHIQESHETLSKLLAKYPFLKTMDWGRLHAQPGAPLIDTCEQYGMHSYAKTFEDFLHYSQLNWQEESYPDLLTFNYPYIYFNDDELNSRISNFYLDSNKQIERYLEKGREFSVPYDLTYAGLDERSNRLAGVLRNKGVMPEVVVGVMVARSIEMIVALTAIIKAGGVYLPIDANYPAERIRYMLADSGAKVLVTTGLSAEEGEKVRRWEGEKIFLEADYCPGRGEVSSPASYQDVVSCQLSPANLAYVIYTSGSTGRPKGVMVEHGNVVRLVKNPNYIDFVEGDRLLLTGNLVFDITTFEIWGVLLNGLNLYLADQEVILDGERLKNILSRHRINILHLVPQVFNLLVSVPGGPETFANLDYLLVGGDLVRPDYINQVRKKFQQLKILHMYGPTENTTFSTYYPIDSEYEERIPIGKPVANSSVYILDRYNLAVPIGIPGELWVGGEGLARGYMNNPELTAQKFQILERAGYHRSSRSYKSYIIYQTGDLARWLADGNIEFLGRIDHQVKIRGMRIELGEIENRLSAHDDIKESVVTVNQSEVDNQYLCAYIVVQGAGHEWADELPLYLSRTLPDHMIPSYFVPIESIPLTPNGKIDRKALPEPEIIPGENYAAPRDESEEKIAGMWAEILGIEKEKISIKSNFFKIGGHSLNAVKFAARVKNELGVEIPITLLYEKPFIKDISLFIKSKEYEEEPVSLLNPGMPTQKNLFCFPPGGAYGLGYREFASMVKNISVYRCYFIEEDDRLEKYVAIITSIQPVGPYIMLGYSGAGKLIFQVSKAFEDNGLEISDIILVDSFLEEKVNEEEVIEKVGDFIMNIQERMEDSGIGFLKERVKEKIQKYLMYNLSVTSLEKVQARVHLVVSEETSRDNHENLHCWDKLTTKPVVFYQGFGKHESMFHPGPVEKNTKVIQEILDNITKN
jgi:amino acid adenylation domain-containing protein